MESFDQSLKHLLHRWSLVALTRDGASAPAIELARDAIEGNSGWSGTERADNLAVLRFVAGAEGVPRRLLEAAIFKDRLMESELYLECLARGKAEGILGVLEARGLPVSDTIRARVPACEDPATLDAWLRRAVVARSAAGAVRSTKPLAGRGSVRRPARRARG